MNPMQEALAARHAAWKSFSSQLEAKAFNPKMETGELVSPGVHESNLKMWIGGIKMTEFFLIEMANERYAEVPSIAPQAVIGALRDLLAQLSAFMGRNGGVFKAYVQFYGYDPAKMLLYSEFIRQTILAAVNVMLDSFLSAMTIRPDRKSDANAPAVVGWAARHKDISAIWTDVLGKEPDPKLLDRYELDFQQRVAKYAESINPKLQNRGPVMPADLDKVAQQTGIPVEKLMEALSALSGAPATPSAGEQPPPG